MKNDILGISVFAAVTNNQFSEDQQGSNMQQK